MIMSDSLKKIAYWVLVLTLIVAEIGSLFDLLNINPWCYPVYAALLILYNKFSSYNPISKNRISKIIAIGFIVVAVALTIIKGLVHKGVKKVYGLEHWLGILDWLFVFSDNRKLLFCTCQKGKI